MIRRFLISVLFLLLLSGCTVQPIPQESAYYTFTDDTGAVVTLGDKPKTVAVLLSSLADLWITAGGHVDITVGETVQRGFAPEGSVLVDHGAGKTINLEVLVASEPDLVLYSPDLAGQLSCAEVLSDAGIPAAGFRVETFQDYLRVLKICTDILGTSENYETHGVKLQQETDRLINLAQSQPQQPRILFVRAGSSDRYTKAKNAKNHFVCAMLQELGAINIADDAPLLLDGLSTETILVADPDAIFFTTMGDEQAGTAYISSLLSDPVWQSMTAVKCHRVYPLPKDLFQYKPNARWDEAYTYLIERLYGDIV